jgi:4-hydroxy-2-oxoheptanedioate aldolase
LHSTNFDTDPATYYARANDEILVVVMIEHVKGVESAEEILSVPGIDVVFIGPNDLLNSMGRPPAFHSDEPAFTASVDHVRLTARKHGVASGIHVLDAAAARRRIDEGFQFIAIGSEAGFMLSKAAEIVGALGTGGARTVIRY